MAGKLIMVVGGQFGSEGKGAVAAYLGAQEKELCAVRVAGPNAGHSVVAPDGKKWKLQQVPVAAVTNPGASLFIAAGSEVNLMILKREVDELDAAGYAVSGRLYVDPQATLIEEEHLTEETELRKAIGSTGEGIGAARAARIMRKAKLYDAGTPVAHLLMAALDLGATVLIEGTQGYGLGLRAGFYPKCTSSDCRALDFLAMAGVSPWAKEVREFEVWMVLRTHPIRVAGDSGPLDGEKTWEELGLEPEYTTVTKKMRRVGSWNARLVRQATEANGGAPTVRAALMFVDYIVPELKGQTDMATLVRSPHWNWIINKEHEINCSIGLVGTGPGSMIDLRVGRRGNA